MNELKSFAASFLVSVVALYPATAQSANLSLSDTPLFVSTGVKSNIMLIVDDSGSMDSEVLFPTNDGALWWDENIRSAVAADGGLIFGPGLNKFVYLFPNGQSGSYDGRRVYGDGNRDHFAIPPTGQFAFARSPDYNKAYYDPRISYKPWPSYAGLTFADVPKEAAPYDIMHSGFTINLTQDAQAVGSTDEWKFRVFQGMWSTVDGSAIHTASTSEAKDITYFPATYYRRDIGESTVYEYPFFGGIDTNKDSQISADEAQAVGLDMTADVNNDGYLDNREFDNGVDNTVSCAESAPSHYLSFQENPDLFEFGDASDVKALAPDGACLKKYKIDGFSTSYPRSSTREDCANPPTCTYDEEIQNFANWFTYYRRRHQGMRGSIASAFQNVSNARVGLFWFNNRRTIDMRDWDSDSERNILLQDLYGRVHNGGTPTRNALDWAGQQYQRTDISAPITDACQQNFSILFTDGYSTISTPGVGNSDGTSGIPYADEHSDTLADVAMNYYENLNTIFGDQEKVPVHGSCSDNIPPPVLDCNRKLHMNTFGVGLGVRGTIFGNSHTSVANAYSNPPVWPDVNTERDPRQVDDLYHAAINGRGEMLNADTPEEIRAKMEQALSVISGRTSSAASVALNSGFLTTNNRLYQARFESGAWTGQVLSYVIEADGRLGSVEWDAGCKLTGGFCAASGQNEAGLDWNTGRQILTSRPDNSGGTLGIAFRWPIDPASPTSTELDTQQVAYLSSDPDTSLADGLGKDRLEHLRGKNVSGFRTRNSLLGDIVNSAPVYVGKPAFYYPDTLEDQPYSAFRQSNESRAPVVYVGANDGMLHAFDAGSGIEKFAYIPSRVFKHLHELSSPTYAHRYFVDGTPTAGDVFFSDSWHSVLVGSLRGGGQGLFALNVTDPSQFLETNAADLVLWEFTDANDPDLGYTYSRPAIVRLYNGKWAAVVGNGYNNTEADDYASTTGNAVLYIVDIENGDILKKIDTDVGSAEDPTGSGRPNGLATPAPVDVNGDYTVDYIYAGDLFGNVWKFDVTADSVDQWQIGNGGTPLFNAEGEDGSAQPITTGLEVGRHPSEPGFMIYFGTGKYIENNDNDPTGAPTQTFYGIWDKNTSSSSSFDRTALVQQWISEEITVTFDDASYDLRVTSDNPVSWDDKRGWYMDFIVENETDNRGERVFSEPILRGGKIIFTTLQPSKERCDFGGTSWLMELDSSDGSRLKESPFDLNGDGFFNLEDYVTVTEGDNSNQVPVSGRKSKVGIVPTPTILKTDDKKKEIKYLSGSTGALESVSENRAGDSEGRQSWRQIQ